MMPLLDGAQTMAWITEQWPDVIMIGLTAGDFQAHVRLLSSGARAVFDKTQIIDLLDWLAGQNRSSIRAAAGHISTSGWKKPGSALGEKGRFSAT